MSKFDSNRDKTPERQSDDPTENHLSAAASAGDVVVCAKDIHDLLHEAGDDALDQLREQAGGDVQSVAFPLDVEIEVDVEISEPDPDEHVALPDGGTRQDDVERRCTTCGKPIDDLAYELWLFHTCQSCVAEPAPARWDAGMAPGTSVKWSYTPRWHLDQHPDTGGDIVADGGRVEERQASGHTITGDEPAPVGGRQSEREAVRQLLRAQRAFDEAADALQEIRAAPRVDGGPSLLELRQDAEAGVDRLGDLLDAATNGGEDA